MAKVTTVKAISGNAIKNNGSTIVYGVTSTSTRNTLNRTFAGYKDTKGGRAHVIAPLHELALNFTNKALSSGTFAQMRVGQYIIRLVTTKIATVTNKSIYNGPVNRNFKSIRYNEHNNTIHNRMGEVTYDYRTGYPTTTPIVTVDAFGNDLAARPTRSVPGHLTYSAGLAHSGARVVKGASYPAKTD
jgi:hypothetical protein